MIAIGSVLKGQYRIDALIGGGGMAMVYRAFDLNLQRVCAIKQNLDTSPQAQRQFYVEAVVLANLSHPHLARVTDHFLDTAGQQYLVMDFVEGEDLESYVERTGPLTERQALAWLGGVLDALEYCHWQGVIHRDIKPANLVKRQGQDTVVLVDFGIAKQQAAGATTTVGARAASPAYAPPEQYSGHTDARSDIYSLGGTLYYLLTQRMPPDARLLVAGVETLAAPRSINPRISPNTEQAILQALSVRMSDRPASIAEFRRLLLAPAKSAAPLARAGWILAAIALLALVALAALNLPKLLELALLRTPTPTSEPIDVAVDVAPTPTQALTIAPSTPLAPSDMAATSRPTVVTATVTGAVEAISSPSVTVEVVPSATPSATPSVTPSAAPTKASDLGETRQPTSTPAAVATVTPSFTPSNTAPAPRPANTPTAAVSTPVAPPVRPVAALTPCPPFMHQARPGMGLLLIENHLGVPLHVDNIDTGEQWDLPAKQGDVPARLVLDLTPGRHTFVDNTSGGYGRISVDITPGSAFISPIWYNDRAEELVYPYEIANGCR